MQGISIFFEIDEQSRGEKGDNRLSITERYNSKNEFLDKVKEQTQILLDQNYIIKDDFDIVVSACEERYDALISGNLKNEVKQ